MPFAMAYLCRSNIRRLGESDLLVFIRTGVGEARHLHWGGRFNHRHGRPGRGCAVRRFAHSAQRGGERKWSQGVSARFRT